MIDNKPFEIQAEHFIHHQLLKDGFLIAKPSFDQQGSDLLIIENISNKVTPLIKVQSKGRNVKRSSNIKIPKSYLKDDFVVLLYLQNPDNKYTGLYIFFEDDIKGWKDYGDKLQLYIPKSFNEEDYFISRSYNEISKNRILNILRKQKENQFIKTNYSIIIDGNCLEKAIIQANQIYKEIYPNKIFDKITINRFIEQILRYLPKYKQKDINCYFIYSEEISQKYLIDIEYKDNRYNLFKLNTQEPISLKVECQLERILNVENILLIADDIDYIQYLKKLKSRGVEIIVFQTSENFGSQMFHEFKWADIIYPIGLAMGLQEHEL